MSISKEKKPPQPSKITRNFSTIASELRLEPSLVDFSAFSLISAPESLRSAGVGTPEPLTAYANNHGSSLSKDALEQQVNKFLMHSKITTLEYQEYWLKQAPQFTILARFALALEQSSHSEANVERQFKSLTRTVIKQRSRLAAELVDDISFVGLNFELIFPEEF